MAAAGAPASVTRPGREAPQPPGPPRQPAPPPAALQRRRPRPGLRGRRRARASPPRSAGSPVPGSGHRPSLQRRAAPGSHLPVPFGPPARRPGCCHSRDFRLGPEARALRPVVTAGRLPARARHRSGGDGDGDGGGGCGGAGPGASLHVGGGPGILGAPRPGPRCLAADSSAGTARAAIPWWLRVQERDAGADDWIAARGARGRGEGETAACRSGAGRKVARGRGASRGRGPGHLPLSRLLCPCRPPVGTPTALTRGAAEKRRALRRHRCPGRIRI